MPAVAQRGAVQTRQQTTTNATTKVRRSRPRRATNGGLTPAMKYGLIGLCVIVLLSWMSVYARLAVAGKTRSELTKACAREQLRNQQLRIQLDVLCRPRNVVADAQKSGMVYASRYEYIGGRQHVASAEGGAGD